MSETDVQRAITQTLRTMGVWVIRTQASGRRGKRSIATGEPGMPDLYLPGLGHIEVKRPGEKRSTEQVAWHERAEKAGVRVATVTSPLEAADVVLSWMRERKAG